MTDPIQRDALARQDAAYLGQGLVPGDNRSSEAHLRQVARLLGGRQAASPCSEALAHVTRLFDQSVPPGQAAMLACRAGCAFCCSQPVVVSAPEAFFLANAIATGQPQRAPALEAAAALAQGRDATVRGAAWFACPLLDEAGSCSVYGARPISCHAFVSISAAECEADYLRPGSVRVRRPPGYSALKEHLRFMLLAAMRVHGLPLTPYEMNAAVSRVLATPDAEARWLGGEDIFAGLAPISPIPDQAMQTIAWLAGVIGPTL